MKKITRYIPAAGRVFMGLVFLGTGLFKFFGTPPTTGIPAGAMKFSAEIMASGYLFQLIGATEVTTGALLLMNRFVPLALVILAPLLVNIIAFHLFLFPQEIALPVILVAIEVYLAWQYRSVFRPLLAAHARTSDKSDSRFDHTFEIPPFAARAEKPI